MEYIELNIFLRIKGLANSGGEAKHFIRSRNIKVNGEVETRNKKKLVVGDKVMYKGITHVVTEEDLKKPE